jgi:uncharacterized protein
MSRLEWTALVLIIIGGIAAGIMAFTGTNIFEAMIGGWETVLRIVYTLIGLAGLYMIWVSSAKLTKCERGQLESSPRFKE